MKTNKMGIAPKFKTNYSKQTLSYPILNTNYTQIPLAIQYLCHNRLKSDIKESFISCLLFG